MISNKLLSNAVVGACIVILLLAMVGPVSGSYTTHYVNPGQYDNATFQTFMNGTLADSAGLLDNYDTLVFNPGHHALNNIVIMKDNLVFESNPGNGTTQNTEIDGLGGNQGIFWNISSSGPTNLTFKSLTLRNGYSTQSNIGGALGFYSNTTIISSDFINDTTDTSRKGGAVWIHSNGRNLTVTGSNFTDCSSGNGGALYAEGSAFLIVNSSSFTNCSATSSGTGPGGAIYASQGGKINFCRFGNISGASSGGHGSIIDGGSSGHENELDLNENWWGTNTPDFWTLTGGKSWPTSFLKMGLTSTTSSITTAQQSTIGVNFSYDSNNAFVSPNNLPDGIPVRFIIGSGPGSLSPQQNLTTNHITESTFSSAAGGNAQIYASVDGYNVSSLWVNVSPTVTAFNPPNGLNTATTTVTITGTGFDTTTGPTVNLTLTGYANVTLTPSAFTASSLTATVPAGMTDWYLERSCHQSERSGGDERGGRLHGDSADANNDTGWRPPEYWRTTQYRWGHGLYRTTTRSPRCRHG